MPNGLPAWAQVSPARLAHVERVVALVSDWADQLGLPEAERTRWLRAAWLHDALRDAPGPELRRLVPDEPGPTELLHGPAAAVRARQDGEDDAGVLGAVHWHSLGSAHWDRVGQALYCADFLEPGRKFDREERAALAARFPRAVDEVVREVAARRVAWLVRSGWFIPETTWRFWNHLAGGWPA